MKILRPMDGTLCLRAVLTMYSFGFGNRGRKRAASTDGSVEDVKMAKKLRSWRAWYFPSNNLTGVQVWIGNVRWH